MRKMIRGKQKIYCHLLLTLIDAYSIIGHTISVYSTCSDFLFLQEISVKETVLDSCGWEERQKQRVARNIYAK